jgi:hypothetical protein
MRDSFSLDSFNLDTAATCPLKCPACERQRVPLMLNDLIDMSPKDYEKFALVAKNIQLCGNLSDPIYSKYFLDYLEISTKYKDNAIDVSTAGQGKSPAFWKKAFMLMNRCNEKSRWTFGLDGLPTDPPNYRIGQNPKRVWNTMKAAANVGNNVYWQYIVFNYNENNIETAIEMAKDHGMGFILIKSSRWDHNMNHLKPSNPDYYINNPRPVKWA